MVCSHDSAVSQMRLTTKRPKIIKLHGDFLYVNIKNTQTECQDLEKNMAEKFIQFSHELGLIVIGYGGNDASVMTILKSLLQDKECFPHGIHWCLLKDSNLSPYLQELIENDRVILYQIENFDGLMADFYEAFQLPEPKFATNPLLIIGRQIDHCSGTRDDHSLINKHIYQLRSKMQELLQNNGSALPDKSTGKNPSTQ